MNECRETPGVCQQKCQNEVGTYRCSCRRGYTLIENGKCQGELEYKREIQTEISYKNSVSAVVLWYSF